MYTIKNLISLPKELAMEVNMPKPQPVNEILIINDPSDEIYCPICGRNLKDIKTFFYEFVDTCKKIKSILGEQEYSKIITPSIVATHIFMGKWRYVGTDYADASWECPDCHSLSDEEAHARWSSRQQS